MLQPQLQILRPLDDCGSLVIQDITPVYSPASVGGYGAPNAEVSAVTEVRLIRKSADGSVVTWTGPIPRSSQRRICANDWLGQTPSTPGCGHCGQYEIVDISGNNGDGCYEYTYEVYTGTETKTKVGVSAYSVLHYCYVNKRMRQAALELTVNCTGTDPDLERKLQQYTLAWDSLAEMVDAYEADCSCVGRKIEQIENLLTSIGV